MNMNYKNIFKVILIRLDLNPSDNIFSDWHQQNKWQKTGEPFWVLANWPFAGEQPWAKGAEWNWRAHNEWFIKKLLTSYKNFLGGSNWKFTISNQWCAKKSEGKWIILGSLYTSKLQVNNNCLKMAKFNLQWSTPRSDPKLWSTFSTLNYSLFNQWPTPTNPFAESFTSYHAWSSPICYGTAGYLIKETLNIKLRKFPVYGWRICN